MESLEKDIQMASDNDEKSDSDDTQENVGMTVDDREDEGDDDRHPYDHYEDEIMAETMMGEVRDEGNVELDSEKDEDDREEETVTVGGVQYQVGKKERRNNQAKGQR